MWPIKRNDSIERKPISINQLSWHRKTSMWPANISKCHQYRQYIRDAAIVWPVINGAMTASSHAMLISGRNGSMT